MPSIQNRVYAVIAALMFACLGLAPTALAQASTEPVLVVGKAGDAPYASIQAAVDAAPPGATIRILPGTYPAVLTIKKPLILEGAGWERTTLLGQPPTQQELRDLATQVQRQMVQATTDEQRREILAGIRKNPAFAPAVLVQDAQGVELRGLKIAAEPIRIGGNMLLPWCLLVLSGAAVNMERCALLGSPGNGLLIQNGSSVEIRKSLIAGLWGEGIIIGDSEGKNVRARISDSEIRNCYHYGILIGQRSQAHCTGHRGSRPSGQPVLEEPAHARSQTGRQGR